MADMRGTVLLDLYGTLVEPDWAALLKGRSAIAEKAGLPATAAHRAWDMTHAARMTGKYGSLADDLAATFSAAANGRRLPLSPMLLSQLADQERDNWGRGVRLYPDAMPALILLRSSGLRLAVVTNASAEAASVVDALGLRPMVDDVFASCQDRVLKPDLLGVALRRLGVDAPEATLIDDEPEQLERAAQLGIGTILVQRSGTHSPPTNRGARVVRNLEQAAGLLVRPAPGRRR